MLTARKIKLLATHRHIRKIKNNAMKIEDRLVQQYGLTDNFIFSVWMLRDGRLINGSYEGHQRDVDHHKIENFFKPSKLESPGSSYIYIKKFMNRGNIRMGCSACGHFIEFTKPPSQKQLNKLSELIRFADRNEQEIGFKRYNKKHQPITENAAGFIRYISRHTNLDIDERLLYSFLSTKETKK